MTTNSSNKPSYDDDEKVIDFRKLEKELNSAVEDDAKYWRENDAKFRAVNQKVATYDEFRDMVMASNIKPLEKHDRLADTLFVQKWNSQASKKLDSADKEEHKVIKSSDLPTTGQAFIREWRLFNKETAKQYSYLIQIGGERLANIFKTEIGFGLLGDFGHCLNCEFNEQDYDSVSGILVNLSTANRFSLSVQFLSSKEKEGFNSLFGKLRQYVEQSSSDMDIIVELQKVYGIKS